MYNAQEVQSYLNKYLELGFSPIWLRGKVAKYSWKEFTLTSANMSQYLRPGINWGIRAGLLPSGVYLYFIDLDTKDLLSSALESKFDLLHCPIVSTGKGFHVYCTWTSEIKTQHDRLNKVDIITNGYVVCPPSVHQSGKPYRFVRPLNGLPPLVNPESLIFTQQQPNPIINKSIVPMLHHTSFDTPADNSSNTTSPEHFDPLYCASQFPTVQQGQRHTVLVSIIGIELARSFTEEETLAIVLAWNKKNIPPMTQAEVINTVRDCYQRYDKYVPIGKSPLDKV